MNQESIKNKTQKGCLLMLWIRTAIGKTMGWRWCNETRKKCENYWKGRENTLTVRTIITDTISLCCLSTRLLVSTYANMSYMIQNAIDALPITNTRHQPWKINMKKSVSIYRYND